MNCPGEGRRWQPGMGRAICPVCHRSSGAMSVRTKPSILVADRYATVPVHTHAQTRAAR